MAKKKNHQQTSGRHYKRQIKLIQDQLNIFGKQAIEEVLEKELSLKSAIAGNIIDGYKDKYQEWLRMFCKKKGMKLTLPLLNSFETNMLEYIEKQYKNDEENKTDSNRESSNN